MKKRKGLFLLLAIVLFTAGCQSIDEHMEKGQFDMAETKINKKIASGTLDPLQRIELENKKEIMRRTAMDFNKSREDIRPYIEQYYPDVSDRQIRAWEESKALEYMIINGEKKYFARAAQNLFRIDKEAKARKTEVDGRQKDRLDAFLEGYIPALLGDLKEQGEITGKAHKMKFTYTLTVDADAVPDGETVRCWLPFPREGIRGRKGSRCFPPMPIITFLPPMIFCSVRCTCRKRPPPGSRRSSRPTLSSRRGPSGSTRSVRTFSPMTNIRNVINDSRKNGTRTCSSRSR
ncbi:MAG: hypothetical protein U5N26_01305 [Candidatus Marinimicrobia bacterium]|nr:hypothetical protein [Candidatus Neomarinimicrobiota bacterium]